MGWFDKNHTAATGASRVLGFSVFVWAVEEENVRTCHPWGSIPPCDRCSIDRDGYGLSFLSSEESITDSATSSRLTTFSFYTSQHHLPHHVQHSLHASPPPALAPSSIPRWDIPPTAFTTSDALTPLLSSTLHRRGGLAGIALDDTPGE